MCNFIPDFPGPIKHSKRRGGRWYEDEQKGGNRGKFGGTVRKEDENCRQIIKNSSCLHRKT